MNIGFPGRARGGRERSRPERHGSDRHGQSGLATRLAGRLALAAALWPAAIPSGQAQDFPAKPIRLVVPFAPGAATDTLARKLAAQMAETLKQSVVVDNVPGAGGSIGAAQVARAPADGYTMLLTTGTLLSTWAFNKATPYDPVRDFRAIGEVARVPLILVAPVNAPYGDYASLRAYALAHPGKLSYGTPGVGTPVHIFSAYLFKLMGAEAVHVPYKGGSQQKTDLISGQVSMSFESPVATLPLLQSGQLKAIFASRPIKAAPGIPSASQSGLKDFEPSVWYGIVAPAGVADARIGLLEDALAKAVSSSDVDAWMVGQGAVPSPVSAAGFQQTLAADAGFWRRMIAEAGIRNE